MIDELMKEAIYYSLNPEEEKNMNLETPSASKRILVHDENDEESQAFFTTCTTRSKRRLVLNAQPTSISTAQGMFSVTDKIGSPVSQLTMQSLESNSKSFDTMLHWRVKARTTGKYDG
jgi:hypothetical protein